MADLHRLIALLVFGAIALLLGPKARADGGVQYYLAAESRGYPYIPHPELIASTGAAICVQYQSYFDAANGDHQQLTYSAPYCNVPTGAHAAEVLTRTVTCSSGQVWNSSTAQCSVSLEQQACNALAGGNVWVQQSGQLAPGQTVCTETGCQATMAGTLIRAQDKTSGQWTTEGPATYTATTCAYSPTTDAQNDSCPGGTSGQVNGVTVCVPYDSTKNVIQSIDTKVTTGTSTVTTGTGTSSVPTTTTSTTTTTCSNGYCSTVNDKAVSAGGTFSTDSTSTKGTQTEYCKDHPTDPQCAATAGFSGSCSAGFTCTGDAVQCSIAKATYQQKCALVDDKTGAEPQAYAAAAAASSATGISSTTLAISSSSFDSSNALGVAGQCITDKSVTVWGKTMSLPFSQVCPSLSQIGSLLLGVSYLVALMIVGKGVR